MDRIPGSGRRVAVIGVGGGGVNAARHLAAHWPDGPDVLCINTDAQSLSGLAGAQVLPIGARLTEGWGAGGDVAVGRLAAEEDRDRIRDALDGVNMAILLTCLGGGTGTGAAPVVAEIAREQGAVILAFATLPFTFEGEKRSQVAEDGLHLLAATCDVVVRLPNEYLLQTSPEDRGLAEAFSASDEAVYSCVRSLMDVLNQSGVINLDFGDLRLLAEGSKGLCSMASAEASGEGKAEAAASAVLVHPLLSRDEILPAVDVALVSILGGTDLALSDVQKTMKLIQSGMPHCRQFLLGATVHPGWTDHLSVTLLVPFGSVDAGPAGTPPAATAEEEPLEVEAAPRAGRKSVKPSRDRQTSLNFDPQEKGRFRNVEPTIYEGEDLDIPTYIRRGVKLSFEK